MIERTPASTTAASNGTRYSSRSVRSSISDEIVIRSSSVSLPTKCFTHAATRSRCRPRMYDVPSRDVSTGSSLKHSKLRPPIGVRCRLTVGASTTWALFDRASRPAPGRPRSTSSGSHVAPSAVPHGNDADAGPVHVVPRTPAGPSDVRMAGIGGSSNDAVCHVSTPASRATFWSSVRAAMVVVMSSVIAGHCRSHGWI